MNGLTPQTLEAIRQEALRGIAKHGTERSALSLTLSNGAKLAILGEEFGEVCNVLTYDSGHGPEELYKELIQVANVAACWAQALDERVLSLKRKALESSDVVTFQT
ncbi:hypothetical protein UFOVP1519_31 [uncultured Caudovirales phage]|uniref:Uncharacterized protein n=1 Tax=uncultured Caudovirales phage TaxID=2100421 RepID=A0A6J5S9A8_9CAUD|nr:hypothetical protein UFOVP1306_33 [uncultured Caudovirales phage]CAB4210277.1 hypothetical protein UFOVP1422_35 [uncultured Caudovirales phage]CAB5227330.1 hypothetical protein UFOVP1519_31 [uncultured Caudovirales phage]